MISTLFNPLSRFENSFADPFDHYRLFPFRRPQEFWNEDSLIPTQSALSLMPSFDFDQLLKIPEQIGNELSSQFNFDKYFVDEKELPKVCNKSKLKKMKQTKIQEKKNKKRQAELEVNKAKDVPEKAQKIQSKKIQKQKGQQSEKYPQIYSHSYYYQNSNGKEQEKIRKLKQTSDGCKEVFQSFKNEKGEYFEKKKKFDAEDKEIQMEIEDDQNQKSKKQLKNRNIDEVIIEDEGMEEKQ